MSSLVLTAQQATARLADLRTRNGKLTADAVAHIAECNRLSQEFERAQSSIHQRDTEAVSSVQHACLLARLLAWLAGWL